MAVTVSTADQIADADDFSRFTLISLFREVRSIMVQRHRLEYRLLGVLRELDQREQIDGRPFHLASWMTDVFGIGYGAAREKVRTARALGDLPAIDAAFREGKLSYSKVRALTRVASSDNEEDLAAAARFTSTEGVERMVRRLKQRERLDDVQALLRQRSLSWRWEDDGSLVVHGRLTPEQGAVWVRALEKAETELAFVENESAEERSVAERSAEGNDRMEDDYRARRADAMTHVLQQSLSGTSDSPGRTGDAFQVSVHVSAETLCGGEKCGDEKSQSATIDGGPHLHPETVRRLTCDGALVSIFEDEDGDPLNVGRRTRVIPAAIHRGLKARDEECQYPGCSQTRFVEAHHIVHWAHGGETRLSNLMMLCTRHHRLVHEFGYQVRRSGNGFEFVRPP